MPSPLAFRPGFALITLLVLSDCKPLRTDIFHPPPEETLEPAGGTPDAGEQSPDAGGHLPDAETSPFCFEDDQWGWDVRLVFDRNRIGHFAYVDTGLPYIVTTRPGAVPLPITTLHTSSITDLKVDALGFRHVLFYADEQGHAVYAHDRQLPSFQTTALDVGQPLALSVEPGGAAHMLSEQSGFKYGTNRSGQWVFETLYVQATPSSLTLAVDDLGYAHVAYEHAQGDGIFYSTNASGTWSTEQVDPKGSGRPVLAFIEGRTHLFYWNQHDFYFQAVRAADGWKHSPIARGAGATIALQVANGIVHVVFDSSNSSLSYAHNTGGFWSVVPLLSLKTSNPTDSTRSRVWG